MAVSVNVTSYWAESKRLYVLGTLTFSGNYTTGGDSVTLSGLVPGQRGAFDVFFISNTNGYVYKFDPANSQILVYQSGGSGSPLSQLAAGAYPSGVTGDNVTFFGIAKKFV